MTPSLTITYVTGRKDPKIDWFFDSLDRQIEGSGVTINEVIVVSRYYLDYESLFLTQVKPKPNVWQGEHRLTKEDWWAMSNARNTALCLCKADYIAYVDDL